MTVVNDTTITAVSPAGTGTVNVFVITTGGTSAATPLDLFNYGPSVTSISPSNGPLVGGTVVTITGTDFTGVTAVDFGTTPATSFTIVSDTSITAVSPPSAISTVVDVTVTTPSGTSPTSPADQFAYLGVPTISLISPDSGPSTGGTEVTITGTNLGEVTTVDFGTAAVTTLISDSSTQIVVLSPASSVLRRRERRRNHAGRHVAHHARRSVLLLVRRGRRPRVTSINPSFGPPSGGTLVTIQGSGFDPGTPTTVYFGVTPATSITVVNTTTIMAVSPPSAPGTVNVTVTTYGGTSRITPADQFTYGVNGPQVTSVLRYGYHAQPTYLTISFDTALDPAPAQKAANYQIVGPNGRRIKVRSAVYNAATDTVTLLMSQRLNVHYTYSLTINGTAPAGLTSSTGVFLSGTPDNRGRTTSRR